MRATTAQALRTRMRIAAFARNSAHEILRRRAIRSSVRRGGRARAKLGLLFVDAAGNSTETAVAVKLR
jgi:hypothetical protein